MDADGYCLSCCGDLCRFGLRLLLCNYLSYRFFLLFLSYLLFRLFFFLFFFLFFGHLLFGSNLCKFLFLVLGILKVFFCILRSLFRNFFSLLFGYFLGLFFSSLFYFPVCCCIYEGIAASLYHSQLCGPLSYFSVRHLASVVF